VAPVSTLVDCQRNAAYRDIVNAADMVTPDGMPVVWLAKAKGYSKSNATYGPDLMRALCAQKNIRHYFLGGTPQVAARLEERLKKDFPGINIVGSILRPFGPKPSKRMKRRSPRSILPKPDIVWVA